MTKYKNVWQDWDLIHQSNVSRRPPAEGAGQVINLLCDQLRRVLGCRNLKKKFRCQCLCFQTFVYITDIVPIHRIRLRIQLLDMRQMLRSSLTTGEANNTEFLTLDAAVSVYSMNCLHHSWQSTKCQWNEHFFEFWLIIEGTKEKVLQVIMQLKSIYNKTLVSPERKIYFLTLQRGSNKKKSVNLHYFCHHIFFYWPFKSCPL